ncbi:NAD(P)/FAD-dependent oxidoreductase [Rhabdothermincola sp.]|uniref:NAD(P)/FAD-dependent oxidoreductase n=1 Tax=Rhabdothermincola sp. TaxID=2820405 RepID=UPI002FE21CAB
MIERIAIVGASLAGMHAAHTLRREGFDGQLTVIDADPHTPYDRPPLSKQVLAGEWDAERITLPAALEDLDIDWRLGRAASALDVGARRLSLADGTVVSFDGCVVATGAVPRRLPSQPELAGIHLLRTLDDCLAIRADLDAGPSRVVVIGAGFIGAEVAATCRHRGLAVTLVEVAQVPLERALGREIGQVCADLHRDHGVDVRLGTGVEAFLGDGRLERVALSDGSVVAAEVAVIGVGVTPNTSWLEGSGLRLDDGVVCDETLLAAPGVVAAGDIARWPSRRFGELLRVEHWENAVQQGEAAARRLLVSEDAAEGFDPIPWFWSDQYDRKIQLAGRSSADHVVEVVHGSLEEKRFVALYGRDGVVTGVLGFNRPRHVMQLRQLVADAVPWAEAVERARQL